MAYQALYRQWRPATFSMMVGQEAVVKTLRSQVASGRVAHAYLFCGSRGTGKTSAAKIMIATKRPNSSATMPKTKSVSAAATNCSRP